MLFTIITSDAQFAALKLVVLLLPAAVKMDGPLIQTSSARSAGRVSTGAKQSGRLSIDIDGSFIDTTVKEGIVR